MGEYFNTWTCGDLTPEQEERYKKFFEDNGIKSRQDVAEYYEKKGIVINYGCPNWWPIAGYGTLELAKEYYATFMAWRMMNEGFPKGSGEGGPGGEFPGGSQNAAGAPGPGETPAATDNKPTDSAGNDCSGGCSGGDSSSDSGSSDSGSSDSGDSGDSGDEATGEDFDPSWEGEESEDSSESSSGGDSLSAVLKITDAATSIYDAVQHIASVNASVKRELKTRVQVQTQLQSERDAEKKQNQDEAYKRAEAFVKTLKQSKGDIMTIATSIPAVIEQTMGVIKSDDELEKTSDNRKDDKEDSEESPPVENTDQQSTESESPDTAEQSESIDMHRGSCGGRGGNDPKPQKDIIDQAKDLGEKIWDGLCNGESKEDIENNQTEGEKQASELAKVDTGKDANDALGKKVSDDVAEEAKKTAEEGIIPMKDLTDLIKATYPDAAKIIGDITGCGEQGKAPVNTCASQEKTVNSILGGLLAKTARNLLNSYSVTKDVLSFLDDIAKDTCNITWDYLDAMSHMDNNSANTAAIAQKNNGIKHCPPSVNAAGKDRSLIEEFGIAFVDPDSKLGAGQLVDLVKDAAKAPDPPRDLQNRQGNPVARNMGARAGASTSMQNYDKMTGRGIKFARVTLGTSRQNILTDVLDTVKKTDTSKTAVRTIKRPMAHTTTSSHNRYNCYGRMSFSVI